MNLDKTDRESQRGYPCEAGNALLRKKQKSSMVHVYAISLDSLEGTEGFSCGNQTNWGTIKKYTHSCNNITMVLKFVEREREETPINNIPQLLKKWHFIGRTKKVMCKIIQSHAKYVEPMQSNQKFKLQ